MRVAVSDSTFFGNSASASAGALHFDGRSSALSVHGSVFGGSTAGRRAGPPPLPRQALLRAH